MALTIDSKTVLRAITDHPDTFPAVQVDLDEIARKMLSKQLKAKSTNRDLFQKIYNLAGEKNIATILDACSSNELMALLKKIDPYSPLVKGVGDIAQVRTHFADVATGRVQTSVKAEKVVKTSTKKISPRVEQPKIGTVLESKVHSGKPRAGRIKKAS